MPETAAAAPAETAEGAAVSKPAEAVEAAPPVKTMKSIVLMGFGGLKMVKVQDKPEPTVAAGEVLIRVKACGLNFPDLMVRQGVIENPPKTPVILGFECSGLIEAVGENVTTFSVGDKVVALTDYGAWGELVSVSANHAFKMPTSMSFHDGAALLMNYVTAYVLLFDMANLRRGQSILIHSVGGGVGTALTQLCRTVEEVTIYGTASAHKHENIKATVNNVFDHTIDYAQEIRKLTSGGVDIVLDCLCGEDTNKGINLLKPMGKYILYGSSNIVTGETKSFFSFAKSWWQVDKVNPIKLFDENKVIGGFQLRRLLFQQGQHEYVRDVVNKLFKLYAEGKIRPTLDSVWAFDDVGEAMQKLHDRKNVGKIIIDPTQEAKQKPPGEKQEGSSQENASGGEEKKEGQVNGEQ